MAAKTLKEVNPKARFSTRPGALERHPELAALPMGAIDMWARTDAQLAEFLASLLKADFHVVLNMYSAATSAIQGKMLDKAAKAVLPVDDFKLFRAVVRSVQGSREMTRDRFAHWIWMDSDDLPNALLLFDPDASNEFVADMRAMHALFWNSELENDGSQSPKMPKLDYAKIWVHTRADLNEALGIAKQRSTQIELLKTALSPDPYGAPPARQNLLTDPDIRNRFDSMKA
jgi:hypothetical protein